LGLVETRAAFSGATDYEIVRDRPAAATVNVAFVVGIALD
jgi:hypothetical protein